MWASLLGVFLLTLSVEAGQAARGDSLLAHPANLDFEEGELGRVPPGWTFSADGMNEYEALVTDDNPKSGQRCALIRSKEDARGTASLLQTIDARPFRGRQVRMRMSVRAAVKPKLPNLVNPWLRVDRKGGVGFVDETADRPVTSAEWTEIEIVGDVDAQAESLSFGAKLTRQGSAWIDHVSIDIIPKSHVTIEAPRPLSDRGLANLIAFVRLLGYVRHFHPSDENERTNWNAFAIDGVRRVESAQSSRELAKRLQTLFQPIAPTVRVFSGGRRPALPKELLSIAVSKRVTKWAHSGYGDGQSSGTYSSHRVQKNIEGGKIPDDTPDPAQPFQASLGDGVYALVPLALFSDEAGTLPHGTRKSVPQALDPKAIPPSSALDRATRLAAVGLAWNVFEHFFPYFDVVKTDWFAVLEATLRQAAVDPDERAFTRTLQRMTAHLHDSHVFVKHPSVATAFRPPFTWRWIENKLVIVHLDRGAQLLHLGDVVCKIDGRDVDEVIAEAERLTSAATVEKTRQWSIAQLERGDENTTMTLEVDCDSASSHKVTLVRSHPSELFPLEDRPEQFKEVAPGILYVDSDRFSDKEFSLELPRLGQAKGVIFDYRGAPSGRPRSSTLALRHLIEHEVSSAWWNIPDVSQPDHQGMRFTPAHWAEKPEPPLIKGRIAFLIDERAQSYYETLLAIVEHYRLGILVGERTAGTNGNVNHIYLPGGYLVRFTGMKVLKQDQSQHHGVGIAPTVPIHRTILGVRSGRDEILERAVQELQNQIQTLPQKAAVRPEARKP